MANITGTTGNNKITGTNGADTIRGLAGDDELNGGGNADRLEGAAGDDILNGGAAIDLLIGGNGNDTYKIDNAGEISKNTADAGVDTVISSITYTLGPNQEHLTLSGTAAIDAAGNVHTNILTGNDASNLLSGVGGGDTLLGSGGDDVLKGGVGDDRLLGGLGNDVLTFDANDTRGVNGGGGTDTLKVSGAGATADLVNLNSGTAQFANIEIVSLNAAGVQTVVLDQATVLGLSSSTESLWVLGSSEDLVMASGVWINDGEVSPGFTQWHSGTAILQIQIGADDSTLNLAPDATDDSGGGFSTNEESSFTTGNVLTNDSDSNGDTVSLLSADAISTAGALITDNGDGTFDYDPNGMFEALGAGESTTDTFHYTITDGHGGTDTTTVSVTIAGVNDAPEVLVNAVLGLNEGATVAIGSSKLEVSDADDSPSGLTYTVTDSPDHGHLAFSDNPTETIVAFTQADIDTNHVVYVHDGSETTSDGFSFFVADGGEDSAESVTGTFTISISNNDVFDLSTLDGTNGFRMPGVSADIFSGVSVSTAGDINNDGFDDFIIGAHYAAGEVEHSGVAYVVFGSGSGFAPDLQLSMLDGANGFRIDGDSEWGEFGRAASFAGDVNCDGYDDIIVGAKGASTPAGDFSGASYVIFGKASGFTPNFDISDLDGANGFRIPGEEDGSWFGWSASDAGDINADGFADVIMGASEYDFEGADTHGAYVVFGSASGFDPDLNASSLDGSNGFHMGAADPFDRLGWSVSSAGDVNRDGIDDFLVGARQGSIGHSENGVVYVVFGATTGFSAELQLSDLDGTNGFRILGAGESDNFGFSVSSVGDLNGDGYSDLIAGTFASPDFASNAGTSYVIFGSASDFGPYLDVSALDGVNGFKIVAEVTGELSILPGSSAGDVNGDGFDDIVMGVVDFDFDEGDSSIGAGYIIFGTASVFAAELELTSLDGTNGFKIQGSDDDLLGGSVSSAGDINGDGFDDLIIGATGANVNGEYSGASYVLFGRDFRSEADFIGTTGDDNLSGTAADEILTGGRGNDTLDGGVGNDVLKGGAGDDVIVFDANDTLRIDGDSGVDTLQFIGAGQVLDLTEIDDLRYQGIERIDLAGTGGNSFTLAGRDVLHLADGADAFIDHDTVQLLIAGDADDSVSVAGGNWLAVGSVVIDGQTYTDYMVPEINAEVFVDADITVSFLNDAPAIVLPVNVVAGIWDQHVIHGVRIDDPDVGANVLQVSLTTDLGALSLGLVEGLTFTNGADGTDDATMEFTGTLEDINAALHELTFQSAVAGDGTVTLSANDLGSTGVGGPLSGTDTFSVTAAPLVLVDDLDGEHGFRISGAEWGDGLGWDVIGAGDTNGDGYSDIIISGLSSGPYLIFGSAVEFPPDVIPATPFVIGGEEFGSAGDFNGDGFADVISGNSLASPHGTESGQSYVLFGKGSGFESGIPTALLDGSNGFRISGEAFGDHSGFPVSGAGDVNADGFADIIIGASGLGSAGGGYVVFGAASGFSPNLDLSTMNGANGFQINGENSTPGAGWSVSNAGDFNGDGFDDVMIGSPSGGGRVYVVFAAATGFPSNVELSALDGSNGFRAAGEEISDLFGSSVDSIGDLNGDGFADIVIGAGEASPNGHYSGASYLVFGAASGFAANLDVSTLDGTNGFKISGEAVYDLAGGSVSSAGDVNGDGFDDLLIGAGQAGSSALTPGSAYVVFGAADGFAAELELSELDGVNGFRILGAESGDGTGHSVSSAGDLNGDGFADLVIGAPGTDANGSLAGATYVVFGMDFRDEAAFVGGDGDDSFSADGTDDILVGGLGNDTLNGGGGNDVLTGGAGNDTLNGDADYDSMRGGTGADSLNGGAGSDRLEGDEGNDSLDGGPGNDILVGGIGNDKFVFNDALGTDNVDTIMDFGGAGANVLDVIHLDNSVFTSLSDGALSAGNLVSGASPVAADANDFILYDTSTGELFYDADGNGSASDPIKFAILITDPDLLNASDFLIV